MQEKEEENMKTGLFIHTQSYDTVSSTFGLFTKKTNISMRQLA